MRYIGHRLFFILVVLSVCMMFGAVIATPTLSFDDLFIARSMPQFLSADGWAKTIWWALALPDVGQINIRTYGLTRLIQLLTVSVFGASSALTFGFVVVVHALSGLLIYKLLLRAIEDKVSSVLLAVAWVASPAVLPTIRAEHHWLYLIAPYYVLIGWLVLNEKRFCSVLRFCFGCFLLVLVWLLGEAPIVPVFFVCGFWMLTSPNWKKAIYTGGQALVAFILMGAYLVYQWSAHHNPNRPQRFAGGSFSFDELGVFFWKLFENAKGVLGLPYLEMDGGVYVPSFHVTDRLGVWTFFVILMVSWFFTEQARAAVGSVKIKKSLVGSVLIMWLGSLGIYFVLVMFQATVFPLRYTLAFYLFTPIALVLCVFAISKSILLGRSSAALVACLTVAFSTALALRYEYKINRPNRDYIEKMAGMGVVLYYPDTPGFVKGGEPNPTYPGLVPSGSPGYGDPKSSIWTLTPMLELYSGAVVGSECRFVQNGMVELLQGPKVIGVRPQDRVQIIGSDRPLQEICDTL